MTRYLFLLLLLVSALPAYNQEAHTEHESESEHHFHRHQVGIVTGHSHVSRGVVVDGRKWEILPSFAFFYNYRLNEKWGIGLHMDMILEDFEVERHLSSGEKDEVLDRNKPFAPVLVGIFKPTKHSSFLLGFGAEFAEGENFLLTRIEYEWSTEISEKWELVISLAYDLRWDAYDVWMLGIGVARSF